MRFGKKLVSRRGETLTEILCALLVVVLSGVLLATMVGVSARLNHTAAEQDAALYAALTAAEGLSAPAADSATIRVTVGEGSGAKIVEFPVTLYGEQGRLVSYQAGGAGE